MWCCWLAMLTRDLLTSAHQPFQWSYREADWFLEAVGFETVASLSYFIHAQGPQGALAGLGAALADSPLPEVREGEVLAAAFMQGWADFSLGVTKPRTPAIFLASPAPAPAVRSAPWAQWSEEVEPAALPVRLPVAAPLASSNTREQKQPSAPGVPAAAPVCTGSGPAQGSFRAPEVNSSWPQSSSAPTKGKKRVLPVGPGADLSVANLQGARQKQAVAIASDPVALEAARMEFREQLYAPRTVSSHLSEIVLYTSICAAQNLMPFPMTHASLEAFCAAMRTALYCPRSIPQYINAVFRQQRLLWMEIPATLYAWKADLCRGAKRGSGDAHRVLPMTREMLIAFRDLSFIAGHVQVCLFHLMVVAWFFVLRSDEAVGDSRLDGLRTSQFEFNTFSRQVTVILGVTKTNSEGLICKRTLACCCPEGDLSQKDRLLPLCPYCAAQNLVEADLKGRQIAAEFQSVGASCRSGRRTRAPKGQRPVAASEEAFRPADGSDPPNSAQLLAFLRAGLALLGFALVDSDGQQNYGTHSLRRGAAQALCEAGWSIEAIKFFGRWLSSCVELYLLSVPVKQFGQDISASMICGHRGLGGVNSKDKKKPDFSGCVPKSFKKSPLLKGSKLYVHLPEYVNPSDLEDPEFADLEVSGWLPAVVLSILPELPVVSEDQCSEISLHSSMKINFPSDYALLSGRTTKDRCAVLSLAPEHPLVVVCFRTTLFSHA